MMATMSVEMEFHFSASHILPRHPGRCKFLHGHNYKVVVSVRGRPEPESGMVIDFYDLEDIVQREVLAHCDHKHLNDFIENPTAENIVVWMWEKLSPHLPGLAELRLWETHDCLVVYRGED